MFLFNDNNSTIQQILTVLNIPKQNNFLKLFSLNFGVEYDLDTFLKTHFWTHFNAEMTHFTFVKQ